jgi:hypothetical protein
MKRGNQVRRCKICDTWWQTHECNKTLFRCPECGSTRKQHILASEYGNRLFTSHILPHDSYNQLIFGSERGRTWHNTFGKIEGTWVEKARAKT